MDLTSEQVRDFVGPRYSYYLERWSRIGPGQSRALGLNWPAFFFTVLWLLYRRLYRLFWIVMAIAIVGSLLEGLALQLTGATEPRALSAIIALAVNVTFGTFGTYWYYLHAARRIRTLTASGELTAEHLRRAGGTSWLALALGLLAFAGMGLLALIGTAMSQRP